MFNPYELLKQQDDIELIFKHMPARLRGYYARYSDASFIVINKSLRQIERRCVLTEELAHYFLGHSGNYFKHSQSDWIRQSKQEYDALAWATDRLLDGHDLLRFMRQDHQLGLDEILETLSVTQEILFFRLNQLANARFYQAII